MHQRKEDLRKIVLDIVFGREKVGYEPTQFAHLAVGVAEVINKRAAVPNWYGRRL